MAFHVAQAFAEAGKGGLDVAMIRLGSVIMQSGVIITVRLGHWEGLESGEGRLDADVQKTVVLGRTQLTTSSPNMARFAYVQDARRVNYYLPGNLIEAAKLQGKKTNRSASAVVAEALHAFIPAKTLKTMRADSAPTRTTKAASVK